MQPQIDRDCKAIPKDVTLDEMMNFKITFDQLQASFMITATALGIMRTVTKRAVTPTDFWNMTVVAMAKELAEISPQTDAFGELMKR